MAHIFVFLTEDKDSHSPVEERGFSFLFRFLFFIRSFLAKSCISYLNIRQRL